MTRVVILFLVMLGALDAAYIEVNQNMKALYKGVKLTEAQESYILDNQDKNINILKSIIKEEVKKLDTKFVNDKNVVEFMMNENGTIDNVKFLKKSDERSLDKMTMKIVEQASKQMITPKEKTPMRFIFIYRIGQSAINSQSNDSSAANVSTYEIPISRGTTRFEHTSKEYVRVFETSKDGFVNLSTTPNQCMKRITLLDSDGRKIGVSYAEMLGINVEILKGSYKLLLQTKKTCDVSLQYQ